MLTPMVTTRAYGSLAPAIAVQYAGRENAFCEQFIYASLLVLMNDKG